MLPAESARRPAVQRFRRPFGCAVLNVNDVLGGVKAAEAGERELTVRLQQAEERDFWQLHELVIRQASKASLISGQGNYGEPGTGRLVGVGVSESISSSGSVIVCL